jgi:glycosyltransferase involved in cell wall biosynthesis
MRLGFHYHLPAEVRDGKIYTLSLQGLFIDNLAPLYEKIVLFLYKPLNSELATLDYAIVSSNVSLVSLVKHYSIPVRLLLSPLIRRKIKKNIKQLDIILLRAPTPLLPFITEDVMGKIPFAYLVVGEMTDHIDNIPQAAWRRGFLKKYILWNEDRQRKFAKNGLVFANSAIVYKKYSAIARKIALIHTTTLTKSDFFFRKDTCATYPIKVLFSGRIEKGKGILEIVEAIAILNNTENIDCRLEIVGWSEPKDPIQHHIKELVKKLGITDKIVFHGKKRVGEELFGYYRQADIFVLASQVAEGFPRTIWEALANSLPVISTAVGSIPHFLKDTVDVLLVEQRNAKDIADKIKFLLQNPHTRQEMIRNGLDTVNEVTLELQAKKIYAVMREYVDDVAGARAQNN